MQFRFSALCLWCVNDQVTAFLQSIALILPMNVTVRLAQHMFRWTPVRSRRQCLQAVCTIVIVNVWEWLEDEVGCLQCGDDLSCAMGSVHCTSIAQQEEHFEECT